MKNLNNYITEKLNVKDIKMQKYTCQPNTREELKKILQERLKKYKNANLKSSQAIINVNYSTSVRTVLGFYTEYTVTAYGTIIEFK